MATLEPGETLGEILRRLEVLEQRLHGSGPGDGGGRRVAPGAPAPPPTVRERPTETPQPTRGAPRGPAGGAPRGYAAPVAAAPFVAPAVATATATAEPASAALERDQASEGCWRAVIEGINARKRMLGAFLEEIRFLGVGGGVAVVAMDDLHRNVIEEKDNRALVMEELARAFGRPLGLRCAPASAAAGIAPATAPPAAKDVTPLIDQAIAWFQGDVIERRSERTT
jgi:hypothetical protein